MHAARAQPGEMPLADQQPGRPGLLLLRERTSQRIALCTRASHIGRSVGSAAARVREHTTAAERLDVREASFNHLVGAGEQHRGTSRSSERAVCRLMTNSKLVDCVTEVPRLGALKDAAGIQER